MGLPGNGKTTLAKILAKKLLAVHWNADEVREMVGKQIPGNLGDRLEQAKRMHFLCQTVSIAGHIAIADFVCPTPEARNIFKADYTIWVDRIKEGRFEDTNNMFVPPDEFDYRIDNDHYDYDMNYYAKKIALSLQQHKSYLFNPHSEYAA